ncbi:hypothetical protein HAX54_039418, partial [Datura stramonium]|nr:hypothetical protein [Datura stramonium]
FWNEYEEVGLHKLKVETFNTIGHTSAASSAAHCHASATRGVRHKSFSARCGTISSSIAGATCHYLQCYNRHDAAQ